MNEKHVGTDFDNFLREEGLLEEVEAVAAKRVLVYQISEAMKEQELSKVAMAGRTGTSRSSLDRLVDPDVPSPRSTSAPRATRWTDGSSTPNVLPRWGERPIDEITKQDLGS